jgi:hypothetical protein
MGNLPLPLIIQRYNARNRTNGQAQRCLAVYDGEGYICHVVDELEEGRAATVAAILEELDPGPGNWIDIGDVDVRPNIYRRMMHYLELPADDEGES